MEKGENNTLVGETKNSSEVINQIVEESNSNSNSNGLISNPDIPKVKRSVPTKAIVVSALVLLSVIIYISVLSSYNRNKIADGKYRDGLKILLVDDTENFNETESYFKEYRINYSYSKHIEKVDQLLKLISQYHEKSNKLSESSKLSEYLNQVGDIVSIFEDYVYEAQKIHNLADRAINEKDYSAAFDCVQLWNLNTSYYVNVANDLSSISERDVEKMFFTNEEYDDLRRFIVSGMVPGAAVYDFYNGVPLTVDDTEAVKESWDTYNELESRVQLTLTTKKELVQFAVYYQEKLKKECDELSNRIKTFS